MGHGLLNAVHHKLSGKTGRSQNQTEQFNLFKTVNMLYDRCIVNVMVITVIKKRVINLRKRCRTSTLFHRTLVNILCDYYYLNIWLVDSKGKYSKATPIILVIRNLGKFNLKEIWSLNFIRTVSVSNLGKDTDGPERSLSCHPRQIQEYFLSIMCDHFFKISFWFTIIQHFTLCLKSKILTALLNRSLINKYIHI
jgi:hypothetical protein